MLKLLRRFVFLLFLSLFAYSVTAACDFSPKSKNTVDFINEISSLNTQLQSCPVPLNSAAKLVFGNNQKIQLTINRNDGSTTAMLFVISGGSLSSVSNGADSHGYEILMDECTLDSILKADSRSGAFSFFYLQGKVKVLPKGLLNRIAFTVVRLLARGSLQKMSTPVELSCLKENGAVCNHGGECVSGNCVGEGQGPPWTYKCSCDPFTYKTSCPQKPQPITNPSGKRPAGENCDHGGQCETGNCIGVGQGPPWTYKCSCDPFKFTTGC